MTVDRTSLSQRAETDTGIPVALSSDDPCDMWYGTEVLQHTADAIDMTRATNGLPMLADHDRTQLIGRLTDLTIGADGKLRAIARPGASAKAAEVFADIANGTRPDMSIGYQVLACDEPSRDNGNQYIVTRWMPMEASSVAIPADVTVGVGRAAPEVAPVPPVPPVPVAPVALPPEEIRSMPEPTASSGATAAGEAAVAPATETRTPFNATATVNTTRDTEVAEIMDLALLHNRGADVSGWLRRGLTRTQVAEEILSKQRAANVAIEAPSGHIDLTPKEQRKYSMAKLILAQLDQTGRAQAALGLEREVSDAIAAKSGKQARGFYVPLSIDTRDSRVSGQRASVTGQTVATAGDGGYTVETEVGPLIEILRNRMVSQKLGAQVLTGLVGNIQFPRQVTSTTLNWTGEDPSAANTKGKGTFNTLTLAPKTAQISTAYSRLLLAQSTLDVEGFVRNDIAQVGAIGLDLAAINGSGSASQPTGIINTAGVNSVAIGTNGGQPTFAKILSFISQVQSANADLGALGFAFTPEIVADLMSIAKVSNYPAFLMDSDGTVMGYKVGVTNQLPKTLTKGTSSGTCHAAIYGNWSELLIGEWGGALDVLVDPYTSAGQNMIEVHGFMQVDIGVRHAASFSVCVDLVP